jgi:EpsI family protein
MTHSLRALVSSALLIGAFAVLNFCPLAKKVDCPNHLDTFPDRVGKWREVESQSLDEQTLDVLKADDYLMRLYHDASRRSVWLFIGYWGLQRRGQQIHSPKHCLPGNGWEPLESSRISITLPEPYAPIVVNEVLVQRGDQLQLVFYWFQYHKKAVAGELAARLQMIRNSIFENRSDAFLIRVSSPVFGSLAETRDAAVQYIQAMFPILSNYIPS